MAKRVVHKMAHRQIDFWDKSKGYHRTQLCREYAPYLAKNPILSPSWIGVNCKHCHSGRFSGVPDGMTLKLVK